MGGRRLLPDGAMNYRFLNHDPCPSPSSIRCQWGRRLFRNTVGAEGETRSQQLQQVRLHVPRIRPYIAQPLLLYHPPSAHTYLASHRQDVSLCSLCPPPLHAPASFSSKKWLAPPANQPRCRALNPMVCFSCFIAQAHQQASNHHTGIAVGESVIRMSLLTLLKRRN